MNVMLIHYTPTQHAAKELLMHIFDGIKDVKPIDQTQVLSHSKKHLIHLMGQLERKGSTKSLDHDIPNSK